MCIQLLLTTSFQFHCHLMARSCPWIAICKCIMHRPISSIFFCFLSFLLLKTLVPQACFTKHSGWTSQLSNGWSIARAGSNRLECTFLLAYFYCHALYQDFTWRERNCFVTNNNTAGVCQLWEESPILHPCLVLDCSTGGTCQPVSNHLLIQLDCIV